MELYDVIIVGGGPAGMSAALVLGRCRRKILIFDEGKQRNRKARQLHGYLTRDGVSPGEFREHALRDLEKYYITLCNRKVTDAVVQDNQFRVTDEAGNQYHARRMLVATGVIDNIPDIPGMDEFYGISIHHCPICDGWEVCDKPLAIYGKGDKAAEAALYIRHWSRNMCIISDGPSGIEPENLKSLNTFGIKVIEKRVKQLEGRNGWLSQIVFEDGTHHESAAMFLATGYHAHWKVPQDLNCRYKKEDEIWVDRLQQSSVDGLYVAGDAAWEMKLVIIAAAEGAKAAVAIHNSLFKEELKG